MKQGFVENKEYEKDYEAGAGSLYIPILGDLFPSLFGQEAKAIDKWFIVVRTENLCRYEVDKAIYDQISKGDKVIIKTDKYGMPDIKLL